jgi:signal peptidase II
MTYGIFENQKSIIHSLNLIMLTIIVYMYYKSIKNTNSLYYILPWILILSGATGNVTDRLVNGYVTDYIRFKIFGFTYFNLDDVFIIVGIFLFIFQSFKNNKMIGKIYRFY